MTPSLNIFQALDLIELPKTLAFEDNFLFIGGLNIIVYNTILDEFKKPLQFLVTGNSLENINTLNFYDNFLIAKKGNRRTIVYEILDSLFIINMKNCLLSLKLVKSRNVYFNFK